MKRFVAIPILVLLLASVCWATAIITPTTTPQWSGTIPVNPDAADVASIVGYAGILDELYKQDVGAGDTGSFASSYSTSFDNEPLDPMDATITYDGSGPVITGFDPLYLLIKDGQRVEPYWYIFDLNNINNGLSGDPYAWDGTQDIEITGFWPDQGAISHVAIYGGEDEGTNGKVPEPATLFLLGSGLVGLAGYARKR